jgi:hypothetical protein
MTNTLIKSMYRHDKKTVKPIRIMFEIAKTNIKERLHYVKL